MYDDYAESNQLFPDGGSENEMGAVRFSTDMDFLVDRIRMLHWAMNTLANSEFSIHENNEWIWKFSDVAFEVILRDTKNAADVARRVDLRQRRSASLDTLEAMKAVQRAELRAGGMDAAAIEERVKAASKLVEAEMERWRMRKSKPTEVA